MESEFVKSLSSWFTTVGVSSGVKEGLLWGHLQALGWALAIVLFGILILAFDTRPAPFRRTGGGGIALRDRILGMEQRYFMVVLNGLLLYGALAYSLHHQAGPFAESDPDRHEL